jgi:peptide/nickel transport system ATP-binding protein
MTAILSAESVAIRYGAASDAQSHLAVRDISLEIQAGAAFGLIGESGSGKTSLARTLAGLQTPSAGRVVFDGETLTAAHTRMPAFRRSIQFVYQDSASALNPRMANWRCATEPAHLIDGVTGDERRALAETLFARLRLPRTALDGFPHALSGGQRQRLALARALSTSPRLIILDEPTSALDAIIQAAILDELLALSLAGVGLLLISHDVAVVRHLCTEVAVMKNGELIERGPTDTVLTSPGTAYAQALIAASNL